MKKRMLLCAVLVLSLLLVGCGARAPEGASTEAPAYDAYGSAPQPGAPMPVSDTGGADQEWAYSDQSGDASPQMIVYTGYLDLVVTDTLVSQDAIGQMLDSLGGYVLTSNSYSYSGGLRRVELTLRVPAERFNEAMAQLRDMATDVTRDSVSSEDVGQEYVDLNSRLTALEAKAERLEALMAQAEDTEAVLMVYDELSATQVEIEQVKGRMQYLERSAALSTITVTLTPDELAQPVEIGGWRPDGIAKSAIEALVSTLQFIAGALIWLLLYIVPILLLLGLGLFIAVTLLRLIFRRRPRQKQPPAE